MPSRIWSKHRLICILGILCLILFFGCEFPGTEFSQEIELLQSSPGSILFRGTNNGVIFTGVKISSTLIEVNMINTKGGTAIVNSTLTVLFGAGMLDNSITRTTFVYSSVAQTERYSVRPNAILRFRVNYVTR